MVSAGSDSKHPGRDDDYWTVTVEIPRIASEADVNRIFDAVADAAFDAQPNDRAWDVFIHGRGPRPVDFPADDA